MGSMTDVMKKLREAGAPANGPPDPDMDSLGAEVIESVFSANDAAEARGPAAARPLELSSATTSWVAKRVDPALVAFHDRCSTLCEQYRTIRARLLTLNTNARSQIIAVTSAVPQEGKSVSAMNLAMVLAEGGEFRVAIVDADFRRSSVAGMVGAADAPGLANALNSSAALQETIQNTPLPNLKLIPAGRHESRNFAELLGGGVVRGTLQQLRASFDYTILDLPPVTTVADVGLLAPLCDSAIIVVQMRRTPEPTVQQAVRMLQASNVKILGCILSRFRDYRTHYYGRYYNYY